MSDSPEPRWPERVWVDEPGTWVEFSVVRPPGPAHKLTTEEHSHLGTTDGSQDRAPGQVLVSLEPD